MATADYSKSNVSEVRRSYFRTQVIAIDPSYANDLDMLYGDNAENKYYELMAGNTELGNVGTVYISPPATGSAYGTFVDAINSAKLSGATKLKVSSGRYTFDQSIVIDGMSDLEIECDEGAILDFSTATLVDGCFVAKGGTSAALPALGSNITRNSNTITFATAPSVQPKDVIVITNNADFSWGSYRSYYRRGEFARVLSVSGNTVTVDKPLYDNYVTTDPITLAKLNPISFKFKGGKIIGKFDAVNKYISGIQIQRGYQCVIENVTTEDHPYAHVALMGCFDSFVEKLNCLDYSPNVSLNYAVAVVNSQKITVDKVHARTTRHAITLTGGGTDPIVVNRDVKVMNSQLGGIEFGLDMHGNVEKCEFLNNTIYGGLKLSGDNTTIRGNKIYGHVSDGTDDGVAISFRELKGLSHVIDSNEIHIISDCSTGILCNVTEAIAGGTFKVSNNSIYINNSACIDAVKLDVINSMTSSPNVEIKNNNIFKVGTDPRLSVEGYSGHTFGAVTFSGNKGASVRVSLGNYQLINILNNETIKAAYDGIAVALSSPLVSGELISIKQNVILNAGDTGIKVTGTDASTVIIEDNTSLNNNLNNTASTAMKASVYADRAKIMVFKDNIWGDTQAAQTQARLYGALNCPDFVLNNNITVGAALGVTETAVTKRLS